MFCLGPVAQPCSSSGPEWSDFSCRTDAAASDRLRRDLQSAVPQAWGVISESLQIDSVPGRSVPLGASSLYPFECHQGENGGEFRCSG